MNGVWHVPFKGRNYSGAVVQNFLWEDSSQPIFIMDNHRAALWCWLQKVRVDEFLNLLHIDEHTDTLYSNIDRWLKELPDLAGMSINDYLVLRTNTGFGETELIRWDNYLSIFLERYGHQIGHSIFATHNNGDKPRLHSSKILAMPRVDELPNNVDFWLSGQDGRWIVNVDLDYFFCDQNDERRQMVSDCYVDALFTGIKPALETGKIAVLSLCLTPDENLTGGWAPAEALCARICGALGVDFYLPG